MSRRLSSTGWLVRETIKGLPAATVKVGKAIAKGVGSAGKALVVPMKEYNKQMEKRYKATPEGRRLMKDIKNKGFFKTLKESKKK